jgi:ABC-type lipoprotein release transport system permease subunit
MGVGCTQKSTKQLAPFLRRNLDTAAIPGELRARAHATDPVTAMLTLAVLTACYVPVRRALRVDPMATLRYE